jgi:hypothetical protein
MERMKSRLDWIQRFLMPGMPRLQMPHDKCTMNFDSIIVDLVYYAYQFECAAIILNVSGPYCLHVPPWIISMAFHGREWISLLYFPTYTALKEMPCNINLPMRTTRRERKELVSRAVLCLVFGYVVWIASQVVQHGEICLTSVVDLVLGGFITGRSFFSLVDCERKYEVGLSPYTINN